MTTATASPDEATTSGSTSESVERMRQTMTAVRISFTPWLVMILVLTLAHIQIAEAT